MLGPIGYLEPKNQMTEKDNPKQRLYFPCPQWGAIEGSRKGTFSCRVTLSKALHLSRPLLLE